MQTWDRSPYWGLLVCGPLMRLGHSLGRRGQGTASLNQGEPTTVSPGRVGSQDGGLATSVSLCGPVALGKPSHWVLVSPSRGVGVVVCDFVCKGSALAKKPGSWP